MLVACLAGGVLAWAAPALAQVPGDVSGVDQYVEDLPTGEGDRPAGVVTGNTGGSGDSRTPLSKPARERLDAQGGRDAPLLETLARSSAYGAPQRALPRAKRPGSGSGPGDSTSPSAGEISVGAALSSGVGSLSDRDDRGPVWLLLVLAAISAAIAAVAIYRFRRT